MTTVERPQPYTMPDVEFALLRVAQATEVIKSLYAGDAHAHRLDDKGTALLKLVQLRAWAAAEEVLADVAEAALSSPATGAVATLLGDSIERAKEMLASFIEQESALHGRRQMIDEGDHLS